jgi:H-type lectin domain
MSEEYYLAVTTAAIGAAGSIVAAIVVDVVQRRILKRTQTASRKVRRWPSTLTIFALGLAATALLITLLSARPPKIYAGRTGTVGSDGQAAKSIHVNLKDRNGRPLFRTPPQVIVGISSMDVTAGSPSELSPTFPDGSKRSTIRFAAGATDITPDGFDISFYTWKDGLVHGGDVNWIAFEAWR